MNKEQGEILKQLDRDKAEFTNALDVEVTAFYKIRKQIQKTAKDKKDVLEKLKLVNEYLQGINHPLTFLTKKEKDILAYGRAKIDSLSDSIINELQNSVDKLKLGKQTGLVKTQIQNIEDLIQKIEDNKTKYLNRSYQIFTDADYRNDITRPYNELNAEGKRRVNNVIDFLIREEGFTREQSEAYVAEYLDDIKRGGNEISFGLGGRADSLFLKKRKVLPIEFQELLGITNDPIRNYINTVYKLSNYIGSLKFQTSLRGSLLQSGISKTEPVLGYTKLTSDSEGWKILSDLYVPQEFKEAYEDLMPQKRNDPDWLAIWVKMNAITKIGKTILSPASTARNFGSSALLALNAGDFTFLNLPNALRSLNLAWGTKKSKNEISELTRELLREGVIGDGVNAGEMATYLNDLTSEISRIGKKDIPTKLMSYAQRIYAFGDDFYKVAGYLSKKKQFIASGMSEADAIKKAGDRIRNGYPTYSYIPKNVKALRIIPLIGTFPSFSYEVVRTQTNNLRFIAEDFKEGRTKMAFKHLTGMVMANSVGTALSFASMALIGFDDEDDDAVRNAAPDYQKDALLAYQGKDADGNYEFVDLTAYLPSETLVKPIRILIEDREGRDFDKKFKYSLDAFLSPYLSPDLNTKTMDQLLNNLDDNRNKIYKGDSFMDGIIKDPDAILKYYLKKAGPGFYNNLTEFMRANEIRTDVFGDKETSYGREYNNQDALFGLFGVRMSKVNYYQALQNYGRKISEEVKDDRIEISKKVNSTKVMKDEDVDKLVNKYFDAREEKIYNLINTIQSGKKLGMDSDKIRLALKISGYSISKTKKDIASDIDYLVNEIPFPANEITEDNFIDFVTKKMLNNKEEKIEKYKDIYIQNAIKINAKIQERNKLYNRELMQRPSSE
jgi:hypothetical protein